jgi:hypothetical protein
MSASKKTQNAMRLLDTVNLNLRRAKALSDLVGAASIQPQFDIDETISEAMSMVWDLADQANSAAKGLFELIHQDQADGLESEGGAA